MAEIHGTVDNDDLSGTAEADVFYLQQGGDDSAFGDAGDDLFRLTSALTPADQIDGGDGTDTILLKGDYSAGLVFAASTMVNVEFLNLTGSFDYSLTINDGNLANQERLTVDGTRIDAGHAFQFDGSAETDAHFTFEASAGNDTLIGGTKSDRFQMKAGGSDDVAGGDKDDLFKFYQSFDASDRIDGGPGRDVVLLKGNYDGEIVFNASTMTNVETLIVRTIGDGSIVTDDATVAAGATFSVEASGSNLIFDGSAETDGMFVLRGNDHTNVLIGGARNDVFLSSDGPSTITGNGGADLIICELGQGFSTIVFGNATDSTSSTRDVISDFDASVDKFDLPFTVTAVGSKSGAIGTATFDADLDAIVKGGLGPHGAMLCTATSGTLSGHKFLVINAGTDNGYDAGADYVIEITGYTGTLDTSDFI